jgi:hypothetical protein
VEEAAMVTKRWGGKVDPDTVVKLKPYHYVMSVNRGDGMSDPFRVRGASVEEAYARYDNPDGADRLQEALNANLGRRPVGQILAELETLDERIYEGVTAHLTPASASAGEDDIRSNSPQEPAQPRSKRARGNPGSALSGAVVDPEQEQYSRPDDADLAWNLEIE